MAIGAKYHHECLTRYKNRYRSQQRAVRQELAVSNNNNYSAVNAQVFVELLSFIEDSIENSQFIFKLSELCNLYDSRLKSLEVEGQMYRTKLKQQLLEHFGDQCQEQTDGKAVLLVFSTEVVKRYCKQSRLSSRITSNNEGCKSNTKRTAAVEAPTICR